MGARGHPGVTGPVHRLWGGECPTVEGVGDERGGRASNHLSGGLGEKQGVGGGGQVMQSPVSR